MKYKNCGVWPQTFYGVEFKPGEVHEVPGYITAKNFIWVKDDVESEKLQKKKVGRPAKSQNVEEETKQPVSSLTLKKDGKDDDESKEKE